MATQDEIVHLKTSLEKIQKQTGRSRALIVILFVILLMSFVYAFVQQVAAEKNAEEAYRQRILAEQSVSRAEANGAEAQRQAAIALESRRMLVECEAKRK